MNTFVIFCLIFLQDAHKNTHAKQPLTHREINRKLMQM